MQVFYVIDIYVIVNIAEYILHVVALITVDYLPAWDAVFLFAKMIHWNIWTDNPILLFSLT